MQILQRAEFRLTRLDAKLVQARKSGDLQKITDLETRVALAHESVRVAREAIPRLEAFYQLS